MTLVLTTAQTLVLTSIKAVDSTRANKDQWSLKGYLNDPDGEALLAIEEGGLTASLLNGNETVVSGQDFEPDDCKVLRNGKGVICKVAGARISLKRTNRVPKDAILEVQKNKNKTSSASSYYRASGVFRRQEFEDTLSAPLVGAFSAGGADVSSLLDDYDLYDILYKCTEKKGTRATKFLCKPGTAPPTPAPSASPTPEPSAT